MVIWQSLGRGSMHLHIIEHLTELAKSGTTGFLCPSLAGKGPGGKHGLSEGFKRIVRKAGIDPGIIQGKGIQKFTKRTFHSLRHSFNSVLANAGVSEELRMKLTGHSSKAMNDRYTHLEIATLKNAVTTPTVVRLMLANFRRLDAMMDRKSVLVFRRNASGRVQNTKGLDRDLEL